MIALVDFTLSHSVWLFAIRARKVAGATMDSALFSVVVVAHTQSLKAASPCGENRPTGERDGHMSRTAKLGFDVVVIFTLQGTI